MTHPTDEELDALDAKLASQIGDDVAVIFNHEYLFKQSRIAITALRAQLARREEMHDCAMKERDDATLYADEQKARADRAEAALAALMWAADQLNDHHILGAAVRTGYETPEDRIAALDRVAAAAVKSFCGARDETEALKMALRHAEDRIEAARSRIVMVRTQIEDRAAQGTAIRSA